MIWTRRREMAPRASFWLCCAISYFGSVQNCLKIKARRPNSCNADPKGGKWPLRIFLACPKKRHQNCWLEKLTAFALDFLGGFGLLGKLWKLWKTLGNFGKLWNSLEIFGNLWKSLEILRKPGVSKDFQRFPNFLHAQKTRKSKTKTRKNMHAFNISTCMHNCGARAPIPPPPLRPNSQI